MQKFTDRSDAGKALAKALASYAKQPDVIVLGLPRGGVPVAYEIAKALSAPLDIFIVRKLGVPIHEELAMGALASGGTVVFNPEIISNFDIPETDINKVIQTEQQELNRREVRYRGKRPFPKLNNKIIILVDDGIATGATMRAAIEALYKQHPKKIIIAAPVAALDTYEKMQPTADEMVCLLKPEVFYAVGEWYEDFPQTTDEEVIRLLSEV